jgi:heme oxygenase
MNAVGQTHLFCEDLPKISSQAHALGALYVMEGSTLGGRMISKMLKENLGLESENGAGFFNGYGVHTMQKWNAFKEVLSDYCTTHFCEEEIVSTADDTFLKFNYWMNK